MWSGISNFLFGSEKPEADENNGELSSLLLFPAEEEGWVLVEEGDKLSREFPSTTSETKGDVTTAPAASDRPLTAYTGVRLTSVHLGQKQPSSLPVSRPQACPRDVRARAGKRLGRNALEHSNKVYHYQSKSKKPRHYNYFLCYSNKNEHRC